MSIKCSGVVLSFRHCAEKKERKKEKRREEKSRSEKWVRKCSFIRRRRRHHRHQHRVCLPFIHLFGEFLCFCGLPCACIRQPFVRYNFLRHFFRFAWLHASSIPFQPSIPFYDIIEDANALRYHIHRYMPMFFIPLTCMRVCVDRNIGEKPQQRVPVSVWKKTKEKQKRYTSIKTKDKESAWVLARVNWKDTETKRNETKKKKR